MVPVTPPGFTQRASALRRTIAEFCKRDLSKIFSAWLLGETETAEILAFTSEAAKRSGAGQDFGTVAILGFAADASVLSDRQIQTLEQGLRRLAGRAPVVNGVPMAFSADSVGLLGIALGAARIAKPELTGAVAKWVASFLESSYKRGGAEDWQRCLFAAADRKIGSPLKLAIPDAIESADVRIALLAHRLADFDDAGIKRDTAHLTEAITLEFPGDGDCERAALRLAALEWVIRGRGDSPGAVDQSQSASDPKSVPRKKRGRPTTISDDRKRRALSVKGGKARAQILYNTRYPSPQQIKNVRSILRHFERTHQL